MHLCQTSYFVHPESVRISQVIQISVGADIYSVDAKCTGLRLTNWSVPVMLTTRVDGIRQLFRCCYVRPSFSRSCMTDYLSRVDKIRNKLCKRSPRRIVLNPATIMPVRPFSFSTLMLLVGSLTCQTVSRMTYTVLVETLNPAHHIVKIWQWVSRV